MLCKPSTLPSITALLFPLLPLLLLLLLLFASPTTWAGFTILDMEGIPELFKEGAPNPWTGWNAQHDFEMIRLHTPGSYGLAEAPYPCHHQIISSGKPKKDCPRGWPQAYIQFLFPSFDRSSFVANQGSDHDPLSQLSYKEIGALEVIIQGINLQELKDNPPYFLDIRRRLIEAVVLADKEGKRTEETGLTRDPDHEIAKGTKVADLYAKFIPRDFKSPADFFRAFELGEKELEKSFPRTTRENPLERANRDNYGRFLRRSVSENFANIILGTLLLSLEKPKYTHFVENGLYIYFLLKNDSEKTFLPSFVTRRVLRGKSRRSEFYWKIKLRGISGVARAQEEALHAVVGTINFLEPDHESRQHISCS